MLDIMAKKKDKKVYIILIPLESANQNLYLKLTSDLH